MGKYLCLPLLFCAYVTISRACSSRSSIPSEDCYHDERDSDEGPDTVVRKVFGGVEATHGDYPHQVSLQNTNDGNTHFCGASIIHPKFLLSAAHCFGGQYRVPHIRAVAGEHDLKASDGNREQIRRVTRVIKHEKYNYQTNENDIALVELTESLYFDFKYVRPVGLWDSTWTLPQWASLSGWGVTDSGSPSSSLMVAKIQIRDHRVCRKKFEKSGSTITSNMICAGGYRDACQGDSGGSLTCSRRNRPFLCGIVSWGVGCNLEANRHFPGVYTNVAKYKEWVERSA